MAYLFGAYFVLWAMTFGYLFFLGTRLKNVEQQLERMQDRQASAAPASERQ
jgi:CcmD family protein